MRINGNMSRLMKCEDLKKLINTENECWKKENPYFRGKFI